MSRGKKNGQETPETSNATEEGKEVKEEEEERCLVEGQDDRKEKEYVKGEGERTLPRGDLLSTAKARERERERHRLYWTLGFVEVNQ